MQQAAKQILEGEMLNDMKAEANPIKELTLATKKVLHW
jgi:hypothetical protein